MGVAKRGIQESNFIFNKDRTGKFVAHKTRIAYYQVCLLIFSNKRAVIGFGCRTLELEVFHDKIPNGSMTSHEFNYLFCNLRYLSIK